MNPHTIGDLPLFQCQGIIKGSLIKTPRGIEPVEDLINKSITVACGKTKIKETLLGNLSEKTVKNTPTITVTTKKGYSLTSLPEHKYFASYTKTSSNIYFVYLMYKENVGYRIGTTKLLISNRKPPVNKLTFTFKKRLSQEKATFLWILGAFYNNYEALFYEQLYSIKYNLPTWVFYSTINRRANHEEYYMKRLFNEIDTKIGALNLLKHLNMFYNYPHHIPRCMNSTRHRNFIVTLFGSTTNTINRYNKLYIYHLHHYGTSVKLDDVKKLKKLNVFLRKSKKEYYRIEGASTDLKTLYDLVEKIKTVTPINFVLKACFTNTRLSILPASHVLPGMTCLIENNGKIEEDVIETVKNNLYSGKIYDLNVPKFYNFIANGIVTHSPLNTNYE